MKMRHSILIMVLLISLVSALLFVVGFGPKTEMMSANEQRSLANHQREQADVQLAQADEQLGQLLKLARGQETRGKLDVAVKWQGSWHTNLQAEPAAKKLASSLGLPAPKPGDVQGHRVYTSEELNGSIMGKLSLMEVDGALYAIYRMEADASAADELMGLQHKAGLMLLQNGVAAEWNASVQGLASVADGIGKNLNNGNEGPASKDVSTMLASLEKGAQGLQVNPVDAFEDGTTVSRTYEVPSFGITALIGGRKVGLQMASHTDTVTGLQQVSWGSPMLTIEY